MLIDQGFVHMHVLLINAQSLDLVGLKGIPYISHSNRY